MDGKDNIVLLLGNNIDKKQMDQVRLNVTNDYHIKKAISSARLKYRLLIIISLIGLITFLLGAGDYITIQKIPNLKNHLLIYVTELLMLIITGYSLAGDIKSATEDTMHIKQYLKYLFSKKSPKSPLQIWNIQSGSVSDSQISAALSRMYGNRLKTYFTGMPYYDIRPIDCITISFKDSIASYIKHYFIYKKFFREYATRNYAGNADDEMFINKERKLNISTSVYGILFFSEFLKSIYGDQIDQLSSSKKIKMIVRSDFFEKVPHKNASKKRNKTKTETVTVTNTAEGIETSTEKVKTIVRIEKNKLFSEKASATGKLLGRTLVELCTSPQYFEWAANGSCTGEQVLEICGITYMDQPDSYKNHSIIRRLQDIRNRRFTIPVKRFIAVPKGNKGTIHEELLIPELSDMDQMKMGLILGGAEQNLGLQYLVNRLRWNEENRKNRNNHVKMGIAENAFEDYHKMDYLIGTENLVYGVTNTIHSRLLSNNKNKAEVFEIRINQNIFYNIYGYSALSTKMATFFFLKNYDNISKTAADGSETMDSNQYIPGLSRKTVFNICYTAETGEDKGFYQSEIVKEWDADVINDENKLNAWLAKYKFVLGD